jgi:hypothetical protein
MKPLNICPVKVGDKVRLGQSPWETVTSIERDIRYGRWLLYTNKKHDFPRVVRSHNNLCGMEVKRDTNQ